ncbi:hypothetical protein CDD83_2869 [Cordyceps sp. RAO-2017]|nr:hypothetical protein CDD83_2869 [Cordyceps sp. RAO-2017]
MITSTFTFIAGLMVAAAAGADVPHDAAWCGTPAPSADLEALASEFTPADSSRQGRTNTTGNTVDPNRVWPQLKIQLYFHVVGGSSPEKSEARKLSYTTLEDQLSTLNSHFAKTNITFSFAGLDRTTNPTWAVGGGGDYNSSLTVFSDMRRTLHKGEQDALNVYVVDYIPGPNGTYGAGIAGSPKLEWDRDSVTDDGVVIDATTTPGGKFPLRDLGATLTHEVGHWLGMPHTFGFASWNPPEEIRDTCEQSKLQKLLGLAPQKIPSFGCPETPPDTCPDDDKPDPIDNFMGYNADHCMNNFTKEQIFMMRTIFDRLRRQKGGMSGGPST